MIDLPGCKAGKTLYNNLLVLFFVALSTVLPVLYKLRFTEIICN